MILKNALLIALGTFLFVGTSKVVAAPPLKPVIKLRIVFGSPQPTCHRGGICYAEVIPGWQRPAAGEVIADASFDEVSNAIELQFDMDTDINPETFATYFQHSEFTMESDYFPEQSLFDQLQIVRARMLTSGNWRYVAEGSRITLSIQLK